MLNERSRMDNKSDGEYVVKLCATNHNVSSTCIISQTWLL